MFEVKETHYIVHRRNPAEGPPIKRYESLHEAICFASQARNEAYKIVQCIIKQKEGPVKMTKTVLVKKEGKGNDNCDRHLG